MTRSEFEAEVANFCYLYLSDYLNLNDCHVGYNTCDDEDDIEACVSIECAGHRYALTLFTHPDREGAIAIKGTESNYDEADGAGLYFWLWAETINQENAMMEKAGLVRADDGSVQAKASRAPTGA